MIAVHPVVAPVPSNRFLPALRKHARRLAARLAAISLFSLCALNVTAAELPEPNIEVASRWWPEMENVWTPIGWKDHPLRFNVLYNGILVAEPFRKPALGQGVQLTFIPSAAGEQPRSRPTRPYTLAKQDGGVGDQGWNEGATPVLWTQWRRDGLVLREEVFAHLPGGGPVRTGREPLFAWVRLSICSVEAKPRDDHYGWWIRIDNPHIRRTMRRTRNLITSPQAARYPDALSLESTGRAALLIDPRDKVRLGAVHSQGAVTYHGPSSTSSESLLRVNLPAAKGAHVDLLVPLLPADRTTFEEELSLGFDGALTQCEAYWSQTPETAAHVETPERPVNEAFRQSPKFAEVIAERNLDISQYSLLTGSWYYERLWATPTSMTLTMILDQLGYHAAVEKYLEIFRAQQGTVVPPGKAYKLHPGYFSTPKALTSLDWLTDHGAILYAVCYHALLTGDQRFIDRWMPAIINGCEFIRDARAMKGHGGVEGLLPPAVPTDAAVEVQSVWTDGWNYKGLATAVRLLRQQRHPRAEEFAGVAGDYKDAFVKAMREAATRTPQWTDASGQKHHYVPTALPDGGDLKYPFYLDAGPLFLVYSGLMDADDELMRSAASYFREGPNTKTYDLKGNWDQPVSLRHEMSSCEPCYSWNVYHSHQSGDRYRFLEGMYSLFAGAMSRQTSIGCEHRGGIGGTLCSLCLPLDLARLAVIDERIKADELHLLRLVPLAWLKTGVETKFERIPTEFGPVTLRFQLQQAGRQLKVSFENRFRRAPAKIVLHVPPVEALQEVVVNGRSFRAEAGDLLIVQ